MKIIEPYARIIDHEENYSISSLRYIDLNKKVGIEFISPDNNKFIFKFFLKLSSLPYKFLTWIKPEDRRAILPLATASTIVVTTTVRDWEHIIAQRTVKAAQLEIRTLLTTVKDEVEKLFEERKFYERWT